MLLFNYLTKAEIFSNTDISAHVLAALPLFGAEYLWWISLVVTFITTLFICAVEGHKIDLNSRTFFAIYGENWLMDFGKPQKKFCQKRGLSQERFCKWYDSYFSEFYSYSCNKFGAQYNSKTIVAELWNL